ncbi:MAG TPA: RES domain-containing protein [Solirubrobacteraceae bacterium]
MAAPKDGVWRVGREPDLLSASWSSKSSELGKPNTGNRFDSPTGEYGVRYFATTLDACYGETLARFRADEKLVKVIEEEWSELGFMRVGDIPADWRQRRGSVRVRFPESGANTAFPAGVRFLDIESVQTREALLPDFEPLLKFYGYTDLDVAVVRGHDRRITRYISQWTYEQRDEDDRPLYAGIRYLSRLNSDWECWAVFDHVGIEELARHPILREDEALKRIAKLYRLTVH